MNVIVANERQNELTSLDVDIIKSLNGSFEVGELVEMFRNFFFSKMILDVTALKGYTEIGTYEELVNGIDRDKIVFLLPPGSALCTPNFLSRFISMGIYNFTIDLNGVKFLLRKPNTLQDVIHIQSMANNVENSIGFEEKGITGLANIQEGVNIIGVKNITVHAGATTFIYILKKALTSIYGKDKVVAIEINRGDFFLFGDKNMITSRESDIGAMITKFRGADIFLIDLNDCSDTSFCKDIIYLLEPSTIKVNKLIRRSSDVFRELSGKKVVLNQSLLVGRDVSGFESESGIKVFYNMPPLDDRNRNDAMDEFLVKMGLVNKFNRGSGDSGRGFGLFK